MKSLIVVCLLAVCSLAHSQNFRCTWDGEPVTPDVPKTLTPEEDDHYITVQDVLEDLVEGMGLNADNFNVYPANNVRNFQAQFNSQKGVLEIYYGKTFVKNLERRLENVEEDEDSWWDPFETVLATILSHEIGHLLNGHVHRRGQGHDNELEADFFAGKCMVQFEVRLKDALMAYKMCASIGATDTHPSREERIEEMTDGYETFESTPDGRDNHFEVIEIKKGNR